MTLRWIIKHRRALIFAFVGALHLAAFIFIRFSVPSKEIAKDDTNDILKLVDVEEYIPPPPPPEADVKVVYNQPTASEQIIETETAVIEVFDSNPPAPVAKPAEIEYMPQHKVSVIPEIPTKDILSRIEYPPIAMRQEIEGIVYLELYIDQMGNIRKVIVLKDPGYGFAAAAIAALEGIVCKPAMANNTPVAVRFRYPIRFSLN